MPTMKSMNMTDAARQMAICWQQFAMALKRELGFQICGVPNDTLSALAGGEADAVKAMEIAAIAPALSRDLIYLGYRNAKAKEPSQIALAWRDDLYVDWRDGLQLYAADHNAPLVLVDLQRREHYARGGRNQLIRHDGLPAGGIERGRKLAMARIRRTAAIMPDELAANSTLVPRGANAAEHLPPVTAETVVRLS